MKNLSFEKKILTSLFNTEKSLTEATTFHKKKILAVKAFAIPLKSLTQMNSLPPSRISLSHFFTLCE